MSPPEHGPRPRLEKLLPHTLDPPQRALYDAITGGPRAQGPQLFRLVDEAGGLEGPFNAFLLAPAVGGPLQSVGAALRYATSLTDRAREVAILVVAARWGSAFEWRAHAAVGRHVGLTDVELGAVRLGRFEQLPPPEQLVARTTAALAAEGDLADDAFERAVSALGREGLFELVTLVGYYATLARQLRVFRVDTGRLDNLEGAAEEL